ncbi:MAG TPA: hypothetical protein VK766_05200 [Cytophagaceae bacterium]|jgi:hypothetical protein|nr:hypothetical protein [Cytophagaceae bacterium]
MKKLVAVLVIFLIGLSAKAQNKREQIESARIAFISQRLNLTPAQAEKFWPLYNEFSDRRQDIRRTIKKTTLSSQDPTNKDDVLRANLYNTIALKQKEVDLEKEYLARFLLVISPRQVTELQKAEKDFLKTMLDKLSD